MSVNGFTYPALYETDGETIRVEIPDLPIEPFYVKEENRKDLADIAWDKAAQTVTQLIREGKKIPPSRTLDDLEITPEEDRDAFLIELLF